MDLKVRKTFSGRSRTATIAVLVLFIVTVGIYAVLRARQASKFRKADGSVFVVRELGGGQATINGGPMLSRQELEKRIESLVSASRIPNPNDLQLIDSLTTSLESYLDKTPQRFIEWQRAQGLDLPAGYAGEQEAGRKWEDVRRIFDGADLRLAEAELLIQVQRGKPVKNSRTTIPGTMTVNSSRSDRGTNDVDGVLNGTDSIEMVIPARLPLADEGTYEGEIGFTFTRRPSDGKWIITKTSLRGAPGGSAIPFPPPV